MRDLSEVAHNHCADGTLPRSGDAIEPENGLSRPGKHPLDDLLTNLLVHPGEVGRTVKRIEHAQIELLSQI